MSPLASPGPAAGPGRLVGALLLTLVLLGGALAGCRAPVRPDGGRGLLPVGAVAPDLAAVDQTGRRWRLRDERGRWVVVYFYPKDATPGCTREACAFRDVWDRYRAAGVQVFGVSLDSTDSHRRFAAAERLPFPLLSDARGAWVAAFGVPVTLGMASRVTFVLGPDGRVAHVYPKVDPGVHAAQVLTDVARLRRAAD